MLEFHWCAPLNEDGYHVGLAESERRIDFNYVKQVFERAEAFGYRSVLLGVGFTHHVLDGWTLASAILPQLSQIGAMVAVRPGLHDAPLLAKMASTLDNITNGRLRLNIVTGGRPREEAMYGDYTDHDARYRRTAEFIEICRKLWTTLNPFDYAGEFYNLQQSRLEILPVQVGGPPLYFGGASPAAYQTCARQADVYMMWGEPVSLIKERIETMRRLEKTVRSDLPPLKFGLRINLFARPTEQEATAAAFESISKISPKIIEEARQTAKERSGETNPAGDLLFRAEVAKESVGQDRQWALRSQADENWWLQPGLWAGLALVRRGAGMSLVGSYRQVADYLLEYIDAGVSVFILSGLPHLEEAENIGRNVVPLVREGYMKRNPRLTFRKK